MCAVSGLDAPGGRDLLIDMLAGRLPELANVRRHDRKRHDIMEIARACWQRPAGLSVLADTLQEYDPGSIPVLRIVELVSTSPVLAALPDAESRRARSLLSRFPYPDAQGLLYAAAGDLPLPARPVSTLQEAFDFLAEANARPDGLLPVLVLVEHAIAAGAASDVERPVLDGLRRWNDDQSTRLDLVKPLEVLRSQIAQGAAEPAPACLVVQLSKHGLSSDEYLLSHWRQRRPGSWRPERGEDQIVALGEVEAAVEQLVESVEEEWGEHPGRPVLEFVLPLQLLNHPMEWLPTASDSSAATPLCLDYPVALRSLERMRARQFHRRWRNRWQQLAAGPRIVCHWDTTGERGHDPVRWNRTLAADERLVSVALTAPPLPGPGGRQATLEAALLAGVPLAVWDRRPAPAGDFRKRVDKLLKGTAAELPQRVRKLRNEAATAAAAQRDAHTGRHLAVLLDNPNRMVDWSEYPASDPGSVRGGHNDEGTS
ncbi:VMAP-C domain-containing protein [Streptomyces sp. NPDC054770]